MLHEIALFLPDYDLKIALVGSFLNEEMCDQLH